MNPFERLQFAAAAAAATNESESTAECLAFWQLLHNISSIETISKLYFTSHIRRPTS